MNGILRYNFVEHTLYEVIRSNFSGYLLPWDQLAYWAITICTAMLDYIEPFEEGAKREVKLVYRDKAFERSWWVSGLGMVLLVMCF